VRELRDQSEHHGPTGHSPEEKVRLKCEGTTGSAGVNDEEMPLASGAADLSSGTRRSPVWKKAEASRRAPAVTLRHLDPIPFVDYRGALGCRAGFAYERQTAEDPLTVLCEPWRGPRREHG
jgi:hypothetical protein